MTMDVEAIEKGDSKDKEVLETGKNKKQANTGCREEKKTRKC
jgi:hypothetical protein